MKDCGYAIRKAYFDKITAANYELSVYDTIAPDSAEPPFTLISGQAQAEDSDKTSYNFNVSIQFDIVYRTYKSGEVGQKSVDNWANSLLEIIGVAPADYPDASPDFRIVTRKVVSNQPVFDYLDETYIFRRVITIQHFVQQL